ncbi:hypothetical protein ACODUO_15120 [Stenotrophomonas maltophilia]
MSRRPAEAKARAAIEAFLADVAPGCPNYDLCEDGDDGWAFWVAQMDTTSYLHHDMRIEWYGTGWPERYDYDGETGNWIEKEPTHG